ncbi:hypothetical protein AB0A71_30960 [Kitasatospora aureofaciens]|uniref:hypothetical protein n=1 Tax=Kitasatospora aureofaciens TaxID=1894 RepID=UPI0033EC4A10
MSPAILGGLLLIGIDWRLGLLALLPFLAAIRLAFRRVHLHDSWGSETVAVDRSTTLPRAYWRAWAVLLTCASVETSDPEAGPLPTATTG